MPGKMNTGPDKPARVSAMRERKQRSAKRYEGTYTNLPAAQQNFDESVNFSSGNKPNPPTIPERPSTRRNGGTYKQNNI